MPNRPKISCYCPTYRRPHLLEEALQSFLMQDYAGEKELVILNDEPEQTLYFNHPQVRVVNMSDRAPSIESKYNHAMSLCTGSILVPWDDDDIFLPTRLTTIASQFNQDVWFSDLLWTDNPDGGVTLATGMIHNNHAVSPSFLIRIGAYQELPGCGYDFRHMQIVRGVATRMGETTMPTYIYRKHTTDTSNHSAHISANNGNHYEQHAKALDGFKKGEWVLNPHWSADWSSMALSAWRNRPIPKKLHEIDDVYPDPDKCKTPVSVGNKEDQAEENVFQSKEKAVKE